jgi:FkbM family methyltransferase
MARKSVRLLFVSDTVRPGFIKGVWRHLASVPRLVFGVRGWPYLLFDCLGFRRHPYQLVAAGGIRCEIRPGTSDWWIFLEIFVFGIYRRVQSDIRGARQIIDVGANVGFFAIFSSALNPSVQVHAFEPFPSNVDQLRRNLRLNGNESRIHAHPDAISDKAGTVQLYFTPGDDSGCSLSEAKDHSCPVNAVAVNDLFRTCGITACDVLKMDCEGSELPILRAASAELLEAIQSIILEYHVESEVAELTGILSRSGFRCEQLKEIRTLYASR